MESFTIELVSNASAQLFPDNTLSSFTNFLPEQLNLDRQWEVAIVVEIGADQVGGGGGGGRPHVLT